MCRTPCPKTPSPKRARPSARGSGASTRSRSRWGRGPHGSMPSISCSWRRPYRRSWPPCRRSAILCP
eukprot:11130786-Heterocapsa_arctica.AAC.1